MIDTKALRAEQLQRASEVILHDDFDSGSVHFIAGADVGFEQQGRLPVLLSRFCVIPR